MIKRLVVLVVLCQMCGSFLVGMNGDSRSLCSKYLSVKIL